MLCPCSLVTETLCNLTHINCHHRRFVTCRYEPPEVMTSGTKPWPRRFDIWSIGCVILEFIIWILEGPQGLREFNERIVNDCNKECQYFQVNRDSTCEIHKFVVEKMKLLSQHHQCEAGNTALGDLLKVVREELLVVALDTSTFVNGKDGTKCQDQVRADSEILNARLDAIIKRGGEQQDYWLKGKPYGDVPNAHPATAVIVAAGERCSGNYKPQLTTGTSSLIVPMLTKSLRVG